MIIEKMKCDHCGVEVENTEASYSRWRQVRSTEYVFITKDSDKGAPPTLLDNNETKDFCSPACAENWFTQRIRELWGNWQ